MRESEMYARRREVAGAVCAVCVQDAGEMLQYEGCDAYGEGRRGFVSESYDEDSSWRGF